MLPAHVVAKLVDPALEPVGQPQRGAVGVQAAALVLAPAAARTRIVAIRAAGGAKSEKIGMCRRKVARIGKLGRPERRYDTMQLAEDGRRRLGGSTAGAVGLAGRWRASS